MTPGAVLARGFAIWLLIMLIESVHGGLRTLLLAPAVGDFPARQIGVFTGSLLILAVTYLSLGWLRLDTGRLRLAVGTEWAILTLAFEVGLGRLVLGYPWSRLAADYDLVHGGLMGLGLLLVVCAPSIAYAFATRGARLAGRGVGQPGSAGSSGQGGALRHVGH